MWSTSHVCSFGSIDRSLASVGMNLDIEGFEKAETTQFTIQVNF